MEVPVPQNGWFTLENPTKMDENWGYPYFRKPSNPIVNLVGGDWNIWIIFPFSWECHHPN